MRSYPQCLAAFTPTFRQTSTNYYAPYMNATMVAPGTVRLTVRAAQSAPGDMHSREAAVDVTQHQFREFCEDALRRLRGLDAK